jgi:hypothetical protein
MKCPICDKDHNPLVYNISGMEFTILPCEEVVPDVCHLFQEAKVCIANRSNTLTQDDLNYIAQGMRYEKSDSGVG